MADSRSTEELAREVGRLSSAVGRLVTELLPRVDRLVNLLELYRSDRGRPRPGSDADLER